MIGVKEFVKKQLDAGALRVAADDDVAEGLRVVAAVLGEHPVELDQSCRLVEVEVEMEG